jgi:host factor-I protein
MTTEKKSNIQEIFLNFVRKNKTPLTMFLVNGIKLQGVVIGFDSFCVMLRRENHVQVVYKHAISTIMPNEPVKLQPGEESETE